MANGNPFLRRSGVTGVPIPEPMFAGGNYSPAILKMAKEFFKTGASEVRRQGGQRGLLDSSGMSRMLFQSFGEGFDRAVGNFQQQQQVYNQWAQRLLEMRAAADANRPPEQGESSWWQRALQGAATGAVVGGQIGGGTGAGVGAISGLLLGPSTFQ